MTNFLRKAALVVAAACVSCAFADQITLKNGDRLTGTIVKSDGKTLVIKADLAGTVTVPWDAVTAFTSSDNLFLTLKDGQTVAGKVTAGESKVQVATTQAGQVSTSKDAIQTIRSKDEQTAYQAEVERMRNPRLIDLWSGSVGASLAGARGNVNTENLAFDMNAARTTPRDKISVYLNTLYSRSDATGPSVTTADIIRGGIGYNFNIGSRTFAFGLTDMSYDRFADLDFRFVGGGGIGWHAIKSERAAFDLSVGGAFDKAFYSTGVKDTAGEVLFGEEYTYKIAKKLAFGEKLVLFPNLSQTGNVRITFDSSLVGSINKWLGWQLTLSDRYLTNPLAGKKRNDLLYTTGIRVTFAR
jgi:putative salt-induced outer membrane protein YdiY